MLRFTAIVPLLLSARALAVEPAAADALPEQVSLRYAGEEGCPTEPQFVQEVLARVRRPVSFGAPHATISMAVSLARFGEQASGKLEVVRPASEPTRREFAAASCAEVGSALALVAALALDPNARTEPLEPRADSTEPGAVTPSPAPAPSPLPPVASPPMPAVEPSPRAAAPSATRYAAWLGPVAGVTVGEAPQPLGLLGVGLGIRAVTGRPFSPSLQLTPLWGKTGVTGPETSKGDFSWATGRLEACPVSFALARQLRLDPCAALEAGRLSARGAAGQIEVPVSVRRWWVAPGATLALHAGFHGWFVRLGGSALFPATRDEFVFRQPNRTVYQASAVVVGAQLGLGFQLGE